MIEDIEKWKVELLFTGRIVQDGDQSVSSEEAERRFNRYVELVNAVDGDESVDVIRSLIDSIQSEHDYGAYQGTIGAIMSFPVELFAQALVQALPSLIDRQPDWAGELLALVVDGPELDDEPRINAFNRQLSGCEAEARDHIYNFILEQEKDGWLKEYVYLLGQTSGF